MKIKVERDNLLKGLETAGRFISKKTNVEMLKNIFLKASDKTLQFAGTDLSVFCKTTINDVNVEQEGEVLIPFKVVYEVVRKIPVGEEITIAKGEKEEKIKISARHFNFTFTTVTIDDYSTFIGPEISETPTAKIAAKDLIENINKVKDAAAPTEEIARPILASVLLERKDDEINFVALDGYRIAWAVSQNKGEDFAVAVNAKTLTEICKVLDPEKITEIYVSSKIVAFKQEGILCKAPLLEGQFIAYKPLFENQFEKQEDISTIEVIKDDIIAAIERASVVALKKENNLIKLEIKGNEMVVSSDSENAIITDKVTIDHKGQDYFIAFNSKYLAEGMKHHSEKITITSLGTGTAPWVISSEEGLKTFILPVKIAAKETELKKVS